MGFSKEPSHTWTLQQDGKQTAWKWKMTLRNLLVAIATKADLFTHLTLKLFFSLFWLINGDLTTTGRECASGQKQTHPKYANTEMNTRPAPLKMLNTHSCVFVMVRILSAQGGDNGSFTVQITTCVDLTEAVYSNICWECILYFMYTSTLVSTISTLSETKLKVHKKQNESFFYFEDKNV